MANIDEGTFRQVGTLNATNTTTFSLWYDSIAPTGNSGNKTLSDQVLYANPFFTTNSCTVDKIGLPIDFNGTSSDVRVAVFSNTNATSLYPSRLVLDAGLIHVNTAGRVLLTVSASVSLAPQSIYWVAIITSGTGVLARGSTTAQPLGRQLGVAGILARGQGLWLTYSYTGWTTTFPKSAQVLGENTGTEPDVAPIILIHLGL